MPHDPVLDRATHGPTTSCGPLAGMTVLVTGGCPGLHVLLEDAVVAHVRPGEQLTSADVDAVRAIDLRVPLLVAGATVAHTAGRGGAATHSTSGLDEIARALSPRYAASGGAPDYETKAPAAERGSHRVRVDAVRPRLLRYNGAAALVVDVRVRTRYEQAVHPPRLREGDEIVDAVLLSSSPAAAHETGQVLGFSRGVTTTGPSPWDGT